MRARSSATQLFNEQLLDDLFWKFYSGEMDAFWEPERRFIAENYETLPFPFLEIEAPRFEILARWTRRDFEGYLNSWSATQKFIRAKGINPVDGFMEEIALFWPENELFYLGSTRPVRCPTRSLRQAACPRVQSASVTPVTAHSSQLFASICKVVVKLKLHGSRLLLADDCNISSRIRL